MLPPVDTISPTDSVTHWTAWGPHGGSGSPQLSVSLKAWVPTEGKATFQLCPNLDGPNLLREAADTFLETLGAEVTPHSHPHYKTKAKVISHISKPAARAG